MKSLFVIGLFTGMALSASTAAAADQTVRYKIANMTCVSCPYIVKKSISAVLGVSKVEIAFAEKTATVTFDDSKTTVAALAAASTNAGYPAELVKQGS